MWGAPSGALLCVIPHYKSITFNRLDKTGTQCLMSNKKAELHLQPRFYLINVL